MTHIETSVGQVVSKMTVTIDDVTIPVVPVEIAAKRMRYSLRHVQRLCESDKLIAIKICNLWFVHELEIEVCRQNGVLGKAV